MRQIKMSDMKKRLDGLQKTISLEEKQNLNEQNHLINSAHKIANSNRSSDIIRFIESTRNKNLPFSIYLELFDSLVDHGTKSQVLKIGKFLETEFVTRPRDAKEMQAVLKRRLTRSQRKVKQNITSDIQDNIANSLPQSIAQPIPPSAESSNNNMSEAVTIYNRMLEAAIIYENCDRVIENYNRISKRFNIDKLIYENTEKNGVYDTVVELCSNIDTYAIPNSVKFNTVIETAWYGFETNDINYTKQEILEGAIDYFLFKKDGCESIRNILETTLFYNKNDDPNIDILMEDEPEKYDNDKNDDVPSIIENYLNLTNYSVLKEDTDFNEIFKKFKKEESNSDEISTSKLKSLISKLYTKNVNNIVEGTPDLLNWVRKFLVVGSCAVPLIGPLLMVILFIADKFISLDADRKEVEKMIKCFNSEIKKSKNKLESIKDPEEKQRMEKYIDALKKAKSKIEEYETTIFTDDEMSKKYEEMDPDDFDDDDMIADLFKDEDFMESCIYKLSETSEELSNLYKENDLSSIDIQSIIPKLSNDDLNNFIVVVKKFPDIFYKDGVMKGIETSIYDIRTDIDNNFSSYSSKSTRLQTLQNAKSELNKINKEDNKSKQTIFESLNEIQAIKEAYSAISILANSKDYTLLEASISNRLKMASMKLKNAFNKLSDKDRQISKNIDLSVNNVKKGIERSLTNDNRESIIKGSILPSASKIIKLAITTGLAYLINPALAVIGAIGYIGCSAKYKAKERQMLIDEIEIESKMCQKYIDIAEQKNDMKALKQLLMIQRDLERQHQRIKYKMKMDFGQKYYDAKHVGD